MPGLLDKLRTVKSDSDIAAEIPDEIPQEWEDQFEQDPPPSEPKNAGKARKPAPPRAPTALKRKVSIELEAYAKMAALGWSMRDPHCGTVLNEQSKAIADSLAEIIARNPELAQKFLNAGVIGDWAKLLMAVQPVVNAFYRHHIARSVEEKGNGGVDVSQFPAYRPGA